MAEVRRENLTNKSIEQSTVIPIVRKYGEFTSEYAERILDDKTLQPKILQMYCGICSKPIGLTTSELQETGRGLDHVCQKCYELDLKAKWMIKQ